MSGGAIPLVTARRRSALARALGPAIADALDAPDVVEALINADGRLWLDRIGAGLIETPHILSPQDREAARADVDEGSVGRLDQDVTSRVEPRAEPRRHL